MEKLKGMYVSVFRESSLGDCTNNGISKHHNRILLIGEGIPKIFEAEEGNPVLILVKRNLFGKEYFHAEPIEKKGKWHMFGGNFVWTSDSRFRDICNYPIPIHDRVE